MGNAQLLGVQFDPKYIGQPSNFEDSVCALIVVTPERVNKGVHWIWRRRFHQGSRSDIISIRAAPLCMDEAACE